MYTICTSSQSSPCALHNGRLHISIAYFRGVRHGAPRRTRFRNPLDFTWISDFRMDFWISKWISGFQSGFLDFKVDFWISKWISGFQADFWISNRISGFHLNRYYSEDTAKIYSNDHEPHSSQPICKQNTMSQALHRYIAHRQRVR